MRSFQTTITWQASPDGLSWSDSKVSSQGMDAFQAFKFTPGHSEVGKFLRLVISEINGTTLVSNSKSQVQNVNVTSLGVTVNA